jgi:hypothetical protein
MPTDYSSTLARLKERERALNAELADNRVAQQAIKAAMEHERCILANPRKSPTVTTINIPAPDPNRKPN